MAEIDNYCLVGKPVVWFDAAHKALRSSYLTQPALVARQFEREFENAAWNASEPNG